MSLIGYTPEYFIKSVALAVTTEQCSLESPLHPTCTPTTL